MIKALNKFKKYVTHKKALRNLIKKYEEQYEVELILEQWLINCITNRGQVGRREELNQKQKAINEEKLFIDYLKAQK